MSKSNADYVKKYLLDPSDKAFNDEEFFNLFVKKGLEFFSGKIRNNKVVNYKNPKELRELLDGKIPQKSITEMNLMRLLDMIGKYSISQADKNYLAFPDSGNSKYAIGGAIFSQFLNQNQIAFDRSAPIGTIIEIQLIEWLRELIGYKTLSLTKIDTLSKVGGMWTPGGNLSNYIAIVAALNYKFPSVKEHGITSAGKKPVILMTKGIEHYSYKSACSWLGLGADSIVWTEPGENYTSSVKNLEKAIKGLDEDKIPFCIVAVAGNCRTSGLDDIEAMARLCKKYKIWLHVDACHGGSFLFSKKYKHLISGIENADSVSLDPHKSLFIPYSSSYVLFKDSKSMSLFSRYSDKVNEREYLDLGLITPFLGSRGFESLKFWLTIKGMGMDVIDKLIERRQDLARYWFQLLIKNENVVVFNELDFYRVSFVIFPRKRLLDIRSVVDKKSIEVLVSKYTGIVSDQLYKDGFVCMDEFKLNDFNGKMTDDKSISYAVMGTTIGNPSTDENHLIKSDKLMSDCIKKIIKKYNKDIDDMICGKKKFKKNIALANVNGKSPASWN